mmetsp:Transcript_75011/g.135097  ORF Transcript_75011/g.135097 Transcript_75011/m.135097 type:complete len:209 (+) Transcript_75011:577-1203(+)
MSRVVIILELGDKRVQRHVSSRFGERSKSMPGLSPNRLWIDQFGFHAVVGVEDDTEQHVEDNHADQHLVGQGPGVTQDLQGNLEVLDVRSTDTTSPTSEKGPQQSVVARNRVSKEHVSGEGVATENGEEHDEEVRHIHRARRQSLDHHVESRVGTETLEELEHQHKQVCKEAGTNQDVRIRRGSGDIHHVVDSAFEVFYRNDLVDAIV